MNSDFRVGPWLVQPSLNSISENGTSTRLEPKVMEVLVCLSHRAGEPVTKEELLQTVWPDTFISDDVLKRSISELRRVFGDDPRESRIIETIPKRGYRLVARVESVNAALGPAADIPTNSGEARRSIASGRGLRIIGIAIGVAATALLLLLLGFKPADAWRSLVEKSSAPQIRSIAVLPLKSLSDDPSQKYFAYGMAEELMTDLSQMSSLKVISHTSVNRYQDSDKPIPQIARELSVDAVVGGAVQRSGDRVRVTAQLIYAPQDSNLWAKTYDGDLRDVLALQSRIAREIADEIQVKMTPEQSARLTKPRAVDPKALDAYWKGQYHLSSLKEDWSAKDKEKVGQQEEFRQAVAYFEEAIRQDPNYAPAYLGYADSVDFFQSEVDPSATSLRAKARSALMKALALDDTLAKAHLQQANIFFYEWNWARAEREYKRALELDPNSADTHCNYAGFLNSMGRLEEGLKEQEMQLQLDPDLDCDQYSPLTPLELQIERERRFIETHHRVTPEHYWDLGLLLWKAGRYKEASDVWQEMMARLGYTDAAQAIGRGYAKNGFPGALQEWAKTGEAAAKQRYVPRIMMAYIYGVLGDHDRAFAWLEKAYGEHESSLPSLKVFLAWDPLRSDPRFSEMIRRVGLPQ